MKKSTYLLICLGIALCLVLACSIHDPVQTTLQTAMPEGVNYTVHVQAHPSDSSFCLSGCPLGASAADELVVHHILELENNPKTKFADWVAYRITENTLGSGCKRTWARDPDLPQDATLEPWAYKGAHEALASDRGHQAPLASLCGSPYWYEADYLSNITPQKSVLNEGPWEHLENGERELIKHQVTDTVYSITGPLYERDMPRLPEFDGEHKVPSGYWKIISVVKDGNTKFIAFVMQQTATRDEEFCADSLPIAELEKRAHLQFFPDLSPQEKALYDGTVSLRRALGC